MAKLPVPTAKEINEAHQWAREHAETAIEWAVKLGRMLTRKRDDIGTGKAFDEWVATHCKFSRATAYNYMKAGKSSNALDGFNSVREALGYESHKPGHKPAAKEPLTGAKAEAGVGAEPAPAEPVKPPSASKATEDPKPEAAAPAFVEPERPDDSDEDEIIAAGEAELAASIDKVMQADDRLAAAYEEIKRQAAEIATLKISRDGYMRGKEAVTKLLKAEQRKVAAMERRLKAAA